MFSFRRVALLIHVVLCLSGFCRAAEERPNVVLLLADDLGWTGLRCFGSDFYETPHLDALAKQSLKFTQAYAACTVCSPTRASIMTGMYPARLHLTDFIAGQNRPFAKLRIPDWTKQLEARHVTIAEALKANGYTTGHVGKWHLAGRNAPATEPTEQGFDVSYQKPPGTRGYLLKGTRSAAGTNYLTDYLTDRACEFIEAAKAQPFFLYFAYHVPHTPIQGRRELVQHFTDKVNAQAVHKNPQYAAMVASLNESVGRLLQQLKDSGVHDRTLVVFTSDNGGLTQRYGKHDGFTENLPLRRGKGSAYEGGVRVPTIMHWPGVTVPGSVSDEPIMTTDLYPTFLEATRTAGDARHNRAVDGRSLVALMRDPNTQLERDLFWHYPHYHAGGDSPYSAIRSGDWRLIEFHEDQSLALYDLSQDIGEQHNLAEQHPQAAQQLLARLRAWRQAVDAQMPTPNPDYDAERARQVKRNR